MTEPSISVLVEPPSVKELYIGKKSLASLLQAVLNPESDPNEDQRVMAWRTEYNVFRRTKNIPHATWRQAVALVAQWKAEDMKARGYFSHQTPEGWWPWDLCRMAGVTPPGYVAECIGYGYREANPLLEAYKLSPTHLQVLEEGRFSHHGTGHAYTGQEPQIYWSMMWLGGIE